MISKLFDRVFQVNVQQELTSTLTWKIQEAISKVRFTNVKLIAVKIDSEGGSNVQARQIVSLLQRFSHKTLAPIYCFAGAHVLNSANIILASGNKVFAGRNSEIGDFGFSQQIWNYKQALDDHKVQVINLQQGEHKLRLNPLEELKDKDIRWLLENLNHQEYDLKRQLLSQRKFDLQLFNEVRVGGDRALELKFIDHIGSLDEVLHRQYHGVKVIQATKPKMFSIQNELFELIKE